MEAAIVAEGVQDPEVAKSYLGRGKPLLAKRKRGADAWEQTTEQEGSMKEGRVPPGATEQLLQQRRLVASGGG